MRVSPVAFKLIFLLTSTLGSLVLAEGALRLLVREANLPRVYHDVREYRLYEDEDARRTSYYRDQSYEVFSAPGEVEVLCLGDSFTNAGNTFWDSSYPSRLYEAFGKQVTVRNLGVCTSTTGQIRDRVASFFAGPEYSPKKKYILAILAGSADLFSREAHQFPGVDLTHRQRWQDMSAVAAEEGGWLRSSYLYRLAKVAWYRTSNRARGFMDSVDGAIPFERELQLCAQGPVGERANCMVRLLDDARFSTVQTGLREHLIIRQLFSRELIRSGQVAEVVRDFMAAIESYPSLLERDYLVWDLLGLAKLQDQVTFQSLVDLIARQSLKIRPSSRELNQTLLANASGWLKELGKLDRIRDGYWQEIVELARRHGAEVIVMGYPLPYQSTNPYLKQMSARQGLRFLDLEQRFAHSGKSNLIDDWEHCSPEGYQLIADTLATEIRDRLKPGTGLRSSTGNSGKSDRSPSADR